MSDKFKKGEIATVLTIGAFIFLSAATLISTVFLKDQKQTTTSKAADSGYFGVCVPAPPISQDTQYTPTGYRWKADCSRACTSNADCPQAQNTGPNKVEIDPATSNWCYGFSDGMKCMMLEKIPGAPIFTCPDSGIPVSPDYFCEYGEFNNPATKDFYIGKNDAECQSCIPVYYSGSKPFGDCKYANPNVCRRGDFKYGCGGICNWGECCEGKTNSMTGPEYDAKNPPGSSGLATGGANPTIPGGGGGGGGGAGGGGGTTSQCQHGKVDDTGACNEACCDPKNPICPTGQTCSIANGYCLFDYSCNSNPSAAQVVVPTASSLPTSQPTAVLTESERCYNPNICRAYTLIDNSDYVCIPCTSNNTLYKLVTPTPILSNNQTCKFSVFTTSNNKSLAKAKVYIYKGKNEGINSINPPTDYYDTGESGDDGIFLSSKEYSREWVTVVVQKDGYRPSMGTVEVIPPNQCGKETQMLPSTLVSTCKFSVFTTSNNKSLAKAKVYIYKGKNEGINSINPPTDYYDTGESGDDGIFLSSKEYSREWVTVVVQKDGYRPSMGTVEVIPPNQCGQMSELIALSEKSTELSPALTTSQSSKTCSPRSDIKIKNIIDDKWDKDYPCGENHLANSDDTLYVYRYCPETECKYDCIRKSDGQRIDCWSNQAAIHHTWLRILNRTTDVITITRLVILRGGWLMSTRKYLESDMPKSLNPKDTFGINFTGTEIECSPIVNWTGYIKTSLTYDTSTEKDKHISKDFNCSIDFSGLIIIE